MPTGMENILSPSFQGTKNITNSWWNPLGLIPCRSKKSFWQSTTKYSIKLIYNLILLWLFTPSCPKSCCINACHLCLPLLEDWAQLRYLPTFTLHLQMIKIIIQYWHKGLYGHRLLDDIQCLRNIVNSLLVITPSPAILNTTAHPNPHPTILWSSTPILSSSSYQKIPNPSGISWTLS